MKEIKEEEIKTRLAKETYSSGWGATYAAMRGHPIEDANWILEQTCGEKVLFSVYLGC